MRQREEQALAEEPALVGGEVFLEGEEVARADSGAEGRKDGGEVCGLRTVEEGESGEAAEEEVAGDEVGEDLGAVGGELGRCLEVGVLEAVGGAEEVVVGEPVPAEVVEKSDSLGGWVKAEERGLGLDLLEEIGCQLCSPTLCTVYQWDGFVAVWYAVRLTAESSLRTRLANL